MANTQDPTATPEPGPPFDLILIHHVEDIPDFATEAEAAEFYATHDLSLIWDQLEDVTGNPPWGSTPPRPTPNVRKRPPAGQMDLVSLRLPADLIDGVKAVAARRHLPYQTLIRSWIAEHLDAEETVTAPAVPDTDHVASG